MTDDERRKLNETHKMAKELYDAFFKPDQLNERPLIKRIGSVVVAVERGSWVAKMASRVFFYIGAVVAAGVAMKTGFNEWKN